MGGGKSPCLIRSLRVRDEIGAPGARGRSTSGAFLPFTSTDRTSRRSGLSIDDLLINVILLQDLYLFLHHTKESALRHSKPTRLPTWPLHHSERYNFCFKPDAMFFGKKKRVEGDSGSLDRGGTTTIPEPATPDTNDTPSTAPTQTTPEEPIYPSGLRLGLLITSVFVAMFLVSLVSLPISRTEALELTTYRIG